MVIDGLESEWTICHSILETRRAERGGERSSPISSTRIEVIEKFSKARNSRKKEFFEGSLL
jgi:hypothetical protein